MLNTRYINAPVLSREGLLGNRYVLIAIALVVVFQLLYTYAPVMQYLFASRPLEPLDWLIMTAVASTVFVLVELEKYLTAAYRRMQIDKIA